MSRKSVMNEIEVLIRFPAPDLCGKTVLDVSLHSMSATASFYRVRQS